MTRRDTPWDHIERVFVGLLGAAAMAVAVIQVLGRYAFPVQAISWAEETIVYFIVWGVLIVSSQLVRTDGHVRPDVLLRVLPMGAQRWFEVFNCLVALTFTGGMVWFGYEICRVSWAIDERSPSALAFPMWLYYACLPAGGGLMFIRYVVRLYRYLFRFDPATMAVGHIPAHELPAEYDSGAIGH